MIDPAAHGSAIPSAIDPRMATLLLLLGGIGAAQLRANAIAIVDGGGVRVGLEDNLWFDAERTQLATNAGLLRRIHDLAVFFERPIMKPTAFRALGFSNRHPAGGAT